MQRIHPDLVVDRPRYYSDTEYRNEIDIEALAERQERIRLLFNPCLKSSHTS